MQQTSNVSEDRQWFVMRDLKRPNAKMPAYKQLGEAGFEVFTPLTTKIALHGKHRQRIAVPYIADLLFVAAERSRLDKMVARIDTLQYRFEKGRGYCVPMTVPADRMEQFIAAASVPSPLFFSPDEISPDMLGARIRMVCDGPLDGLEGNLLKIRGSRKKRLLVRLEGILAAAVEISDVDFVELIQP